LDLGDSRVLGLHYDWEGHTVVAVHNLSDRPAILRLEVEGTRSFKTLLGNGAGHAHDPGAPVDLAPYGYQWFRSPGERR
jgi:maltose alpha-D-glucosyltransferase / alpha-amylase